MVFFKKKRAILGMGSNLGDREKNLYVAYSFLKELMDDIEMASIYETRPLYVEAQPLFLNSVLSGYTKLSPFSLLKELEKIEKKMGRNKKETMRMGARCIDLDILLYGNKIIHSKALAVPHPRIKEREFVLKPLVELYPLLQDPVSKVNFAFVLKGISDQGVNYYSSWPDIVQKYTREGCEL